MAGGLGFEQRHAVSLVHRRPCVQVARGVDGRELARFERAEEAAPSRRGALERAFDLRALLTDAKRRAALGREAAAFIHQERSLDAAAQRLGKLLAAL